MPRVLSDERVGGGVHIGSIEVEIVGSPDAAPSPVPPPASGGADHAGVSLARKVVSQFGLYQR